MKAEKDNKKVMLFFLIAIIIAVPYFFFIRPQLETSENLRNEISALNIRRQELENHRIKMTDYAYGLGLMHAVKDAFFAHYPSELPQEATILFIDRTEKNIPIKLEQISFTRDTISEVTSSAGAVVYETTMEQISSNPLIEGLNGVSNTSSVTFEATYEDFKKFLKYVADYDNRIVIPNISISYNVDTDFLSGQFILRQHALSGEGRERVITPEPPFILGVPMIFDDINSGRTDAVPLPIDFEDEPDND